MITFYQQIQELLNSYSISDTQQIASVKRWYNLGAKKVKNRLRRQVAAGGVTTDLVAGVDAYQLPEYFSRIFGVRYNKEGNEQPLEEVTSIFKWDALKSNGGQQGIPTHFHLVGNDQVELWPTPSENVTNGLMVRGSNRHEDFVFEDVSTGTASLSTNSEVVVLSSNVVTPAWVGRSFSTTDGSHQFAYKISEYVSNNSFKLENYYAGTGGAGHTYLVGDVVDIPEEYLELPMLYAESRYVSIYRKNRATGNDMMAEFTENVRKLNQDFSNPNKSRVVKANRHRIQDTPYPAWWPTQGLTE